MRFMKRKMAAVLAVLLMLPARPALADNVLQQSDGWESEEMTIAETLAAIGETIAETATTVNTKEWESVETGEESSEETAEVEAEAPDTVEAEPEKAKTEETLETETTAAEIIKTVAETVAEILETWAAETKADDFFEESSAWDLDDYPIATPSNATKPKTDMTAGDEVSFNTGNHVWSVVSPEDFWENDLGDVCFEEDGSYTINIPEENPFFPYEVQFTYKGQTMNKWFMTPEDSVDVGGHTFYVSANFDDTAVTQMSLEVAGEIVVAYPEEKTFTDNGDGAVPTSLLPLEERKLTVDLKGYTPVELTMVSLSSLFKGNLQSTDKVVWSYRDDDDYQISVADGTVDLSRGTQWNDTVTWQMIVGDDDQLASGNIRYLVIVQVTECSDWLIPTVYEQDFNGNRRKAEIKESSYEIHEKDTYFHIEAEKTGLGGNYYIGLKVNTAVFSNVHYDHLKIYDARGVYNVEQLLQREQEGTLSYFDLTDQAFANDMTEKDAGILTYAISIAAYDSSGKIIGFQVVNLEVYANIYDVYLSGLYTKTGAERKALELILYNPDDVDDPDYADWPYEYSVYESDTEGETYAVFSYEYDVEAITRAYVGKYWSITEAEAAGAENIKDILFDQSSSGGYKADFSDGVYFSIFVGSDDSENQMSYFYKIQTDQSRSDNDSDMSLTFSGLKDKNGNNVNCYVVDAQEDFYAEYRYLTILAEEGTDLTSLAPVFKSWEGMKVYASGSTSPEKSGESIHDFSKGAVQYTVSSENGANSKNYWLQVVKPLKGQKKLYINSLAAKEAETVNRGDGAVVSTREMIMDWRYNDQHDILLMNIGTDGISNLKAEIESQQVELDSYWTLNGDYELKGAEGVAIKEGNQYGELPNMAKLRLKVKNGVLSGEEIFGTLTLKSGNNVLMVLNLTGTVGIPSITTREIGDGVKYVPYGAVIQNSNKYSWNTVTYQLTEGKLPDGMILKPNGELYGVPTESGEYHFTISMENSYKEYGTQEAGFTLIITENTDANVDAATDKGYELARRVPDITMNSTEDYLMISQGEYEEFVDVFLDGEKLIRGTDYTSEAGSTRITLKSQTLKRSNKIGVHTLGIEFRTKGTKILKRAAQNFRIKDAGSSGGSGSSGSGSSGSNSSGSGGSSSGDSGSRIYKDPKKGYVHTITGIITGDKAGYSHWQQDENGWKLIYADKTTANGYMTTLENKEMVEQIIWEKINGSWYAFGVDGYLKSGWVYDYHLGRWYQLSIDTGMLGGWYKDPIDNHTYYLDPVEGGMSTGWRNIERKWYYFNTIVTEPSWKLNAETKKWQYNEKSKSKPLGAMLRGEKTPDGYRVNIDGVWDGK